jgi:protease I
MKKALIITSKLVQDHEFIYPFYRLKEEGYEVDTFNNDLKQVLGYFGTKVPPKEEDPIISADKINVKNYNVLVLPGGVKSMEILRLNNQVLKIINEFNNEKKIIAATCSAVMLLISAKIIKQKKVSGYYAWKDDIENAGAIFEDKPCVVDENLVTSPHYKYVGNWMRGVLKTLIKI